MPSHQSVLAMSQNFIQTVMFLIMRIIHEIVSCRPKPISVAVTLRWRVSLQRLGNSDATQYWENAITFLLPHSTCHKDE
jgi:hypothetical protein